MTSSSAHLLLPLMPPSNAAAAAAAPPLLPLPLPLLPLPPPPLSDAATAAVAAAAAVCRCAPSQPQAAAYFPPKLYRALEDALLEYGEEQLGCKAISTVWMSYYVDGCVQELHCDNPHGPFAYVVSLTPWEGRSFEGGETMILKPGTLNYWESYEPDKGMEVRLLRALPSLVAWRIALPRARAHPATCFVLKCYTYFVRAAGNKTREEG